MKSSFVVGLIASLIICAAASSASIGDKPLRVDPPGDFTGNPCDDFYQFVCGSWINSTVLPSDRSSLTYSFTTIDAHNKEVLRSIVEGPDADPRLSKYYSACMDTSRIDSQGAAPALDVLSVIDSMDTSSVASIMTTVGRLHTFGLPTLFEFGPTIDSSKPSVQIGQFDQGGLNLPYPSLYLDTDPSSNKIRTAYKGHLQTMFALIGDKNPASSAISAFAVESAIAAFTANPDELTDPFATFNPMTLPEFQKRVTPDLVWAPYLKTIGIASYTGNITVTVPSFYRNLSVLVPSLKNALKPYMKSRVMKSLAPLLSQPFRDAWFDFYMKTINGQASPQARWKECISAVDEGLGEVLGKLFVQRSFPGQSQTDAEALVSGILKAMSVDLNGLSWMDATTLSRALKKLSLVKYLIGSPAKPDTYPTVQSGLDYFSNVFSARQYAMGKKFQQIGKATDRGLWEMTAPTVNAYYEPTLNEMVFPAGILQQPFFNSSSPPEVNAGGIGMVMGHELTHGFDNQGRLYDGNGQLIDWWLPQTSKEFETRSQCVVDQYSKFSPIPGVYVNGKLTLGENIADMGGIKLALAALTELIGPAALKSPSSVSGLTRGQLFFVSYASSWCTKATDAYFRLKAATDPHSPAMFRVNGPLMNLPAFSEIFSCPAGSYMNPSNRCVVW